jgi:hypothetical protein
MICGEGRSCGGRQLFFCWCVDLEAGWWAGCCLLVAGQLWSAPQCVVQPGPQLTEYWQPVRHELIQHSDSSSLPGAPRQRQWRLPADQFQRDHGSLWL